MAKTKRAAIYARMSKDDGDTEGSQGIERQLKSCREVVKNKEWTLDEGHVLTDIASGYDQKAERPHFEQLKALVEANQVDVVVVYALDRVSRRVAKTADFADLLKRKGVELWSDRDGGEKSGMIVVILAMLAQSESEVMSLRLRAKNKHDFEKGIPKLGGVVGYGYRQVRDGDGKLTSPWFEPVPEEAAILQEMAERILASRRVERDSPEWESATALVRDLTARGETTRGGYPWSWKGIRDKLKSPTIAGLMSYNGLVKPAPWEPIIPEEQWRRLNTDFGQTIRPFGDDGTGIIATRDPGKATKRVGVLSGLLFSESGNRMVARAQAGYKLYVAQVVDDNLSIRRDVLDDYVFAHIGEQLALAEFLLPGSETRKRSIADIEAELEDIEAKIGSLVTSQRGRLSQTIADLIDDLTITEERLRAELNMHGEPILHQVEMELFGETVMAPSIDAWLETASLEKKRDLVSDWIERIEIGCDKDAIKTLKQQHNITTEHQWRILKDDIESPSLKTRLKTELRTTITWRKLTTSTVDLNALKIAQAAAEDAA